MPLHAMLATCRRGAPLALLIAVAMAAGPALADPAALVFRGDARTLRGDGPDAVLPDRTVTAAAIQTRFAGESIDPGGVVVWRLEADEIASVGSAGEGLPLPFASSVVFDRASHQRSLRASLSAAEARDLAANEGAIVAFAVRLVPEPGFGAALLAGTLGIAAGARRRQEDSPPRPRSKCARGLHSTLWASRSPGGRPAAS